MKIFIFFMIISSITVAKDIPVSLAKNICSETSVMTNLPAHMWEKAGYRGITIKISDAVIDDSGTVHLITDEHYRGSKRSWCYLKYDKSGAKLLKKEIFMTTYITISEDLLVSRLLVNPDGTVLVFYPDSEFYTCWVKLNKEGNVIEKNQPRWWRGDANFKVCSAGQDSFHIFTFPVDFWGQLIEIDHPVFGKYYQAFQPLLSTTLYYSNNFLLKEKRIKLRSPYSNLEVPEIQSMPDANVFCFADDYGIKLAWIVDSQGNCFDGDVFDEKNLGRSYLSKITIDTMLIQLARNIRIPLNWGDGSEATWLAYFFEMLSNTNWRAVGLFPDSTVGVGIYFERALYLIKYNLGGKIIEIFGHEGSLKEIIQMEEKRTLPFITQFNIPERRGLQIDKTIFYWGYDDKGDFFLKVY